MSVRATDATKGSQIAGCAIADLRRVDRVIASLARELPNSFKQPDEGEGNGSAEFVLRQREGSRRARGRNLFGRNEGH